MFVTHFSLRSALAFTALLAVSALTAPHAYAQNLLVNGSFEAGNFTGSNPNGAPDITQLAPGATNIDGWTVLSGNNVSDIAWVGNNNPYTGAALDGVRYLDLTGFRDSTPYGGVTQTLTLTQGNSYSLSFAIGSFESNAAYRGPMSVRAIVGSLDQTFLFTPTAGSTGQQWQTFTANFTATTAATTLQLSGVTSAGGQFIGLDNASITARGASAAAPEPGSVALVTLGLLPLAGFIARRRAQASA